MKKITSLTISTIILSIGLVNAQTTKGKVLLELSSSMFNLSYNSFKYGSDEDELYKYFSASLSPKAGYFVVDNLAAGLNLSVGLTAVNLGTDDSDIDATINAGPFVRYYIPSSKVLPFLELTSAFGTQGSTTTINLGGGVGLAIPLGDKVMADLQLNYTSLSYKDREGDSDKYTLSNVGLGVGFTILL